MSDGSDGQVLTTNGSGTLSFSTISGGVDGISSSADATAITIDSSERVAIGSSTANKIFNIADPNQGGETLKQLGGNRFIAMTGAKNFAVGPKGMSFKIGRNSKNVNYVRIDLKGDLYNMEFIQMRAGKMKVKSKEKGVYNDQLQKMFTKNTGMYTSL